MAKNRSREEEPSIAPKPDRWYNLSLGPSFRDHHPSSKFCTLRYDFKPASVDKSRAGSLHKTKDNKVTVEFQNNQHGKPKAIFEGVTEDYKDNDAVLFFDGESFRLEQLHRAVKRLRYVRDLSEVAAASSGVPLSSYVGATSESYPPSVGKAANDQFSDKESPKIEVENVDVESDDPQSGMNELYGVKAEQENIMDSPAAEGNTSTEIPDATNYESDEKLDNIDDHVGDEVAKEEEEEEENHYGGEVHRGIEIDINIPHQEDEEDFEIADVDVSDGEVNNTGFNAAEALRAQVAGEREKGSSSSCSSSSRSSSSSSSSSGSESSSDSGSASSGSSASGSSHDESVTSV